MVVYVHFEDLFDLEGVLSATFVGSVGFVDR